MLGWSGLVGFADRRCLAVWQAMGDGTHNALMLSCAGERGCGGRGWVCAACHGGSSAGVVVAVMSVHKLSPGDGYRYLTRQVAAQDASVPAGGLGVYYSEKGEAPGVWLGAGLTAWESSPARR